MIGLAAFLILLAREAIKIKDQKKSLAAEINDLQSRASSLQNGNQFLASSSAYFGSDAYLERQARLDLNYKNPDEKVAFVYQDTSVKETPAPDFKTELAQMPNWEKWWYYLLGYRL